jgi:flagellar hook-length control protein FliK
MLKVQSASAGQAVQKPQATNAASRQPGLQRDDFATLLGRAGVAHAENARSDAGAREQPVANPGPDLNQRAAEARASSTDSDGRAPSSPAEPSRANASAAAGQAPHPTGRPAASRSAAGSARAEQKAAAAAVPGPRVSAEGSADGLDVITSEDQLLAGNSAPDLQTVAAASGLDAASLAGLAALASGPKPGAGGQATAPAADTTAAVSDAKARTAPRGRVGDALASRTSQAAGADDQVGEPGSTATPSVAWLQAAAQAHSASAEAAAREGEPGTGRAGIPAAGSDGVAALSTDAAQAAVQAQARTALPQVEPVQGRVNASPGHADFAPQLAAQLSTFIQDGVQNARLSLHPADMGPVTVQIQLDGQSATVHMSAENADTRQALQQALPQLAASLRESGLTLSGGGVFDQPRQPAQQGGPQGDLRRAVDQAAVEPVAGARGPSGVLGGRSRGVVDLVA